MIKIEDNNKLLNINLKNDTNPIKPDKINILLIENNPDDTQLILELLKEDSSFNFNFKNVDTLSDGIKFLIKEYNDIILLDLTLPDSSGLTTLLEILDHIKDIPIIVITDRLDELTARRSVQLGAQDFLIKGQIDCNHLVQSIYNAIDRYKMHLTIKSLAETLLVSEKKYKTLFENFPYPIILIDVKENVIDCNSSFEKLVDLKKSYLLGKSVNLTKFIDEGTKSHLKKNIIRLVRGENVEDFEILFKKMDNSIVWVKTTLSLIELNENTFVHCLLEDISELKKTENKVKILEKSLKEIDTIIENSPLAIILFYQNGKILRINKETTKLLKISKEEILNHHIFEFLDESSQNKISHYFNDNIIKFNIANRMEAKIKSSENQIIDVEITSNILTIAENIIIQSFISDISDRKLYEENRQIILDKLFKTFEYKNTFFASMSHDLRTPLTAISGFSELLLLEGSLGELNYDQKELINDIKISSDHLIDLINTILDFSKIESGQFQLNLQIVDLALILEDVIKLIRPTIKKKKLEFKIFLCKNSNKIQTDPIRFKQILYNLIDNAMKFTDDGIIMFKCFEKENKWEFQVIDTGIGISPEDNEVVFREFGRIENDKIKQVPGTGIGLALTKRLIELHGGKIWFDSNEGKGTIFYFTIPKAPLKINL